MAQEKITRKRKKKKKSRVLELCYVSNASIAEYSMDTKYPIISAKDKNVKADPDFLEKGIDIGLMKLHINNAPERRKLLGLVPDRDYEIIVKFSPVILHGTDQREVMKINYCKFFNIEKNDSGDGFTYKKMFSNLRIKNTLSFDVQLTEIDNNIVDPQPLSNLLNDTGIGTALDLSPVNPKQYLELASNIVGKIQDVFGKDKEGDDGLWKDTLNIEPAPTIPGSYKLREGFYIILESQDIKINHLIYHNNKVVHSKTLQEIEANYLVFGVGKRNL